MEVTVLYASETGNAEEVAYDISRLLSRNIVCSVDSIENFDVINLPTQNYVVFVVSTTGDGDPPLSMRLFWNFLLRRSLSNDSLSGLSFAVFGLGDSSYEKFNSVARKLHARLQQLGAKELIPLGLGDDQATFGYFSAYNGWRLNLINTLLTMIRATVINEPVLHYVEESPYKISIVCADNSNKSYCASTELKRAATMLASKTNTSINVYVAEVKYNSRLTHHQWPQDVRHLELSILSEKQFDQPVYNVGDVADIYYRNSPTIVQQAVEIITSNSTITNGNDASVAANFIDGVQLQASSVLNIEYLWNNDHHQSNQKPQRRRPSRINSIQQCTLQNILEYYLDIAAVPKRSYFAALAQYATDSEECEKLRELASAEGTDLYFDYCVRERKNHIEVLNEFRSARPPFAVLLHHIPIISPRSYSIASAAAPITGTTVTLPLPLQQVANTTLHYTCLYYRRIVYLSSSMLLM